jgi:hypothetical protein
VRGQAFHWSVARSSHWRRFELRQGFEVAAETMTG